MMKFFLITLSYFSCMHSKLRCIHPPNSSSTFTQLDYKLSKYIFNNPIPHIFVENKKVIQISSFTLIGA